MKVCVVALCLVLAGVACDDPERHVPDLAAPLELEVPVINDLTPYATEVQP